MLLLYNFPVNQILWDRCVDQPSNYKPKILENEQNIYIEESVGYHGSLPVVSFCLRTDAYFLLLYCSGNPIFDHNLTSWILHKELYFKQIEIIPWG